jgi:hypothetical protein
MGFWSGLGKVLGVAAPIVAAPFTGGASLLATGLGAAGAAAGAFSQGQAQNRGAEFAGQLDLERLLMERDDQFLDQQLAREQEGRESATDAYRKLLSAQRVLNPGPRPSFSTYSAPRRQATDMERQGADALSQEVMARLTGGNPIAPISQRPMSVDASRLKAGGMEKALGVASPFLSFLGRTGQQPRMLPSRRTASIYQAPQARA